MLSFVEKLPPWVHIAALLTTSLYVLFSGIAHLPLPPKAAAVFRTLFGYVGGLKKALDEADAVLNPVIETDADATQPTLPVKIVPPADTPTSPSETKPS